MARDKRISSRTIAAVSYDGRLGALLEKRGHWGRVQSWFQRAINVALPTGELIPLVRQDRLNGPGFVCLDILPGRIFGDLEIWVGDSVHFVSPAGTSRDGPPAALVVDLRFARPWTPSPFPPPPPRRFLKKAIQDLRTLLEARPHGPRGRSGERHFHECRKRAGAFIAALERRDAGRFREALLALIGLGEGLTPSGDDFLVGAMAAAWWRKGSETGSFLLEEIRRMIESPLDRPPWPSSLPSFPEGSEITRIFMKGWADTTLISAHFLSAAAEGIFCEFVYRFLESLSARDERRTAAWIDWIRSWGATSGAWLLDGFAATAAALAGLGGQPDRE